MDVFEHCGFETAIAAPTGRAAKRITEATGYTASTIHRLLEYSFTEDGEEMRFGKTKADPLEKDAVIVDEASMIDVLLMKALLEALKPGTRLIVVGDADQLPPVGPGNALGDIIASGVAPCAHLTEIFRQAEESMIIVNAHRINAGEYPHVNEKESDFFLIRRNSEQEILASVLSLCTERLPGQPGVLSAMDVQVLTPVKKGLLGSLNLNKELQKHMNPPAPGLAEKAFGERVFREGDKVMQIRNNYRLEWIDRRDMSRDEGVFNGDKGIIDSIDGDMGTLTVVYDETRYVRYEFSELEQLDHAYAITVHKSQGSEFAAVVIPLFPFAPLLATRNLIYTAVTRGREMVVLTGREYILNAMVDNDHNRERYTGLRALLMEYQEKADVFEDAFAMDGYEADSFDQEEFESDSLTADEIE
jgi:exodeoxyribonuclease V alpha subunit